MPHHHAHHPTQALIAKKQPSRAVSILISLGGFLAMSILLAMAMYLANGALKTPQNLESEAAVPDGEMLPDLAIPLLHTEKNSFADDEIITVRAEVINRGDAATEAEFNVLLGYGAGIIHPESPTANRLVDSVSIPVGPPLAPGETRSFTHSFSPDKASPGYYSLLAVADPLEENKVIESSEIDIGYRMDAFLITSATIFNPTPPPANDGTPRVNLGFPPEGSHITIDVDDVLCAVDVPISNTAGLQRRENVNNLGWSTYVPHYTFCYEPPNGPNTLAFQYRNEAGQESEVIERHFTMQWTCPAGPHANYDSANAAVNLTDYSIFINEWRWRNPRSNYNCDETINLRDYILFLNDWRSSL